MNTTAHHHTPGMLTIIKDAAIQAASDSWTQAGIMGAGIAWLSQWITVTLGQVLGNISLIVGISVGLLAVVEKTIGIVNSVRKMRKEDKPDPFADTEGRK
jgi:hypothetical protein